MSMKFGSTVYCTWAEEETFTRVWGGKAFCANCGATDHETIKVWG